MVEKVNPSHPDKIMDRIAGAIVDLGYKKNNNPKIAIEGLIGHGVCHIIIETNVKYLKKEIYEVVKRIGGNVKLELKVVKQDEKLSKNQEKEIRCGDNGIFKGIPLTKEEKKLSKIAKSVYKKYPYDGKYILDNKKLVICQSNTNTNELKKIYSNAIINPLGEWEGGLNVDTGAINRKLGSDMGSSITGGGIHGKDLSKADVSINIYAFLKAQKEKRIVEFSCAIGDSCVDGIPYSTIVKEVHEYIKSIGGFEKLAEWGLF